MNQNRDLVEMAGEQVLEVDQPKRDRINLVRVDGLNAWIISVGLVIGIDQEGWIATIGLSVCPLIGAALIGVRDNLIERIALTEWKIGIEGNWMVDDMIKDLELNDLAGLSTEQQREAIDQMKQSVNQWG